MKFKKALKKASNKNVVPDESMRDLNRTIKSGGKIPYMVWHREYITKL